MATKSWKTIVQAGMLVFMFSLHQSAQAQCTGCTIHVNGNSSTNYNVKNGDVLCIHSGTYTGNITGFNQDGIVCVDSNATFTPGEIKNWNGTLYNYGNAVLPEVKILGTAALYNYGHLELSTSTLQGGADFENEEGGFIFIGGTITLTGNGSFTNSGDMVIEEDFNISGSGDYQNEGNLTVLGEFDPDKTFDNHGYLHFVGHGDFDNNSGIRNYCMVVSDSGFVNTSDSTLNEGFIWILQGNAQFVNNGTFHQTAGAEMRVPIFVNNGTVTGAGQYYVTGQSTNAGPFGQDSMGINFYDNSLNPVWDTIFDNVSVSPHSSVYSQVFTPNDTLTWGGGPVDAGMDRTLCVDTAHMMAVVGSAGQWSVKQGAASFANANDPNTVASSFAEGYNILRWSAAACRQNHDEVTVYYERHDTTAWVGSLSNDWHNPFNWTHCVPHQQSLAIIQNTTTTPQIYNNRTGVAKELQVENGAHLSIQNNGQLRVNE